MLRCREVSQLVSESMERKLPFRQRMQVWMHLAMCRLCAGFARQIRLLRIVARQHADRVPDSTSWHEVGLSLQARERIKTALRNRGS
jgi:hypothetical protein